MVALPSMLLVLSAGAQVAGPRPAVLASVWALVASPARTAEWLPSVRVAAWPRALVVLLPMVPGSCPRQAHFFPIRRKFAEQLIVPSR